MSIIKTYYFVNNGYFYLDFKTHLDGNSEYYNGIECYLLIMLTFI